MCVSIKMRKTIKREEIRRGVLILWPEETMPSVLLRHMIKMHFRYTTRKPLMLLEH